MLKVYSQRNSTSIADQITLAAQLGPVGRIPSRLVLGKKPFAGGGPPERSSGL